MPTAIFRAAHLATGRYYVAVVGEDIAIGIDLRFRPDGLLARLARGQSMMERIPGTIVRLSLIGRSR